MSTRDSPGGKGGRCVRLTTYHPCSAEHQEIRGLNLPGTPWAISTACCGRDLYLYLYRLICGPSLGETSLCDAYLYLIILHPRLVMTVRNARTLPNVCQKMTGDAHILIGHISRGKDVSRAAIVLRGYQKFHGYTVFVPCWPWREQPRMFWRFYLHHGLDFFHVSTTDEGKQTPLGSSGNIILLY